MNRSNYITWIMIGLVIIGLSFLYSCTRSNKIVKREKIDCGDQSLTIMQREIVNFSASSAHAVLKIDELPLIELVSYETVDNKPYQDGIYGDAPRYYFDEVDHSNTVGASDPLNMILYIDPAVYSPTDFKRIHDVIARCNVKILQWIVQDPRWHQIHISGLVYGTREQFTKIYRKSKKEYIAVYPDGNITRHHARGADGGGLSDIQMPGERIVLSPSEGMTLDKLREYRNEKTDRPLELDFDIIVKNE